MARLTNAMITFNDAIYMRDNLGFRQKTAIPSSDRCMTKSEIETYLYVYINNSASYSSNQLVAYDDISIGLYIEPYSSVSYNGASFTLNVDSNSPITSVSSNSTWLSVSLGSTPGEYTVDCSASKNFDTSSRSATITVVNSNGESAQRTITQAANPGIDTDSVTVGFGTNQTSACSAFTSNWTIKYIPEGETFASASGIYDNSAGTVPASPGYYSDGSTVRYWNGSTFTSSGLCI